MPRTASPFTSEYLPIAKPLKALCRSVSIVILGNLLLLVSRRRGIAGAVRLIDRFARCLPSSGGIFEEYSRSVDGLVKEQPYLFWGRKQPCLVRGLLLFCFGKRRKMDIHIGFGSRSIGHRFDTHCWIIKDGIVRFEVDDVIRQYTPLIEYS